MAGRTQIVCLCEGEKSSIDTVFINKLMKSLKPAWLRREGSNVIRLQPCGSRSELIKQTPRECRHCMDAGADTTLMVWSDCDHNCADGEALKAEFWKEAKQSGIKLDDFNRIVFIFARDRLENWIEFLKTGRTNENSEGPRLKDSREAAEAAKKLADICTAGEPVKNMPPSLDWSCKNWRALVKRMGSSR